MQPGKLAWALLLLCAAPAECARLGVSAARAWLQEHPAPKGDELAELKSANPEAYALVKALLTKRSMGLLNPKHPSASFATPAKSDGEDAALPGPEAFQALAASSSAVTPAAVYPDAPAPPAHHDWLHWQPKQSAMDDEAMVNSVLGAVSELKSGAPHTNSLLSQGQGSASQTEAELAPPPAQGPSAVDKAPAAQLPPVGQENSYLKGLDLGATTPVAIPHTDDQENPYLTGVNLGSPRPKQPRQNLRHDSTDYLASFTWDDEPQKPSARARPSAAERPSSEFSSPEAPTASGSSAASATPTQAPHHGNALMAWLGSSTGGSAKLAALAQPAATAAPEAHRNPYMSYLH